ncbi:MAG: hypothetical protein AVDCRST_MAG19-1769 [uncultured Thermomicrobiales bacterium]|uniref:Uncharacterized protein n=1 Tax=uncultured Thermomicrobiales bacterium TaxID=1645740 RepID=A0A6J4UX90_9BACT|nr:MAG: hypothetical protein AVDCRST_MAG19-1769 [uncultured Thermomicrobiales bacterium]
MCGKSLATRGSGTIPVAAHDGHGARSWSPCGGFGLANRITGDAAAKAPRQQVSTALSVLAPAVAGALFVFTVVPWASWVVFAFGWMLFPVVGLLARGVAGVAQETDLRRRSGPALRAGLGRAQTLAAELRQRAEAAGAPATEVRLARLWRSAALLPTTIARDEALRVCAAAERLEAALAADGAAARAIRPAFDRLLAEADAVLAPYARLAARGDAAAEDALREVEQVGLPLLAAKLDALAAAVTTGDQRATGSTAARATLV